MKSASKQNDLAGSITDRQGNPLADVHVLVILKTWPNNRFRQEDFTGKADKQGRFRFTKLVPAAGQRAIQLAAVKDGYALTSLYELKKDGEKLESDAFKIELDEAVPLTVTVRGAQGRTAAKAHVIPFSRQAADGGRHAVYFQTAKTIEVIADDDGRVRVNVFRRGDKAELYVQLPGKDWEQLPFTVPESGDTVEIAAEDKLYGAVVHAVATCPALLWPAQNVNSPRLCIKHASLVRRPLFTAATCLATRAANRRRERP